MPYLAHPSARRRGAAVALATAVTVGLASPSVATADPVRGLTVFGGYTAPTDGNQPVLFGAPHGSARPSSSGNTPLAYVSAYETTLGSTVADSDATRACVSVSKPVSETTTKGRKTTTTTTMVSDGGCGSLSVTGLGTGIVLVTGSVPSSSGTGSLTVDLRALAHYTQVAVPFQLCGITMPPYISVCSAPGYGIRRHASSAGTVRSDRLGDFDLAALGGPTYVWEVGVGVG